MIIRQKAGIINRLKKVGNSSKFKAAAWFKFDVYLLGGIGLIQYNPYGKRNGLWEELRPLHTEGQGLPNGPEQYGKYTTVIPYGIGIRKHLRGGTRGSGTWSISLELSMRKTFSDYIDDVSNVYYDEGKGSKAISDAYGPDAGYFADPSGVYAIGGYGEPQLRGNVNNKDAYMLGILALNYKVKKRRKNLPKF